MSRVAIPDEVTAVRLVRLVGGELREYQAMGAPSGPRAIEHLLARGMVRPASGDSEYGLADLLDDEGNILAELPLTHRDFRWIVRKLRCRVVWPDNPEGEG